MKTNRHGYFFQHPGRNVRIAGHSFLRALSALLLIQFVSAVLLSGSTWAQISEPATIFYGKVTGTGGAQPFLVQEGALEWTIEKADGSTLQLNTELYQLKGGELSYQLKIPHSVLAYELDDGEGLPLPPVAETNAHAGASVDGVPATFRGDESFTVGQALRSATYRLDLEVPLVPMDSDGDGMPDWWEDANGLDKQLVDSSVDRDGDGLSNLQEYNMGFDPNANNRQPSIATASLLAYPGCATGVRLITDDIDSAPTNLTYTLLAAPTNGTLALRNAFANPSAPDLVLSNGVEFTQADVDTGRIYFENSSTNIGSFVVAVRDETATSATGIVAIAFYNPASGTPAQQRAHWAGLSAGAVVWDHVGNDKPATYSTPTTGMTDSEYASTYVPNYGIEVPQAILGGRGADTLNGGWGTDLLIGGTGTDTMSGGGEADTFVFAGDDLGTDTIADFDAEEGDTIDLDGLLAGSAGWMDEHLDFTWNGSNTLLGVDLAGGGAYTDLVVTLDNVQLDHADAYDLVLNGHLLAGPLSLTPRISVAATDAQASENGNNSGLFTLTREGDLGSELTIGLAFGGAAVNGVDYSSVASTAFFAPGIDQVMVSIDPIADSEVEVDESVELTLHPGSGYVLHDNAQASLLIKDLQPVVEIQILQALGSRDPLVPAAVLIRRNGQTANSLFVLLSIGGNARNGIDYHYVSSFVNFAPGQTSILIEVMPTSGGMLDGGAATVLIAIEEDGAYTLADTHSARVILAERRDYFDIWKDREFPGNAETYTDFAAGDEGPLGIGNLARYAYGMDPHEPDTSMLPQLVFRNGRCQVDVHRNPGVMDVEFDVSVSTNMSDWTPAQKVAVPELEENALIETYQTDTPVIGCPGQFMRVKLIYNP